MILAEMSRCGLLYIAETIPLIPYAINYALINDFIISVSLKSLLVISCL